MGDWLRSCADATATVVSESVRVPAGHKRLLSPERSSSVTGVQGSPTTSQAESQQPSAADWDLDADERLQNIGTLKTAGGDACPIPGRVRGQIGTVAVQAIVKTSSSKKFKMDAGAKRADKKRDEEHKEKREELQRLEDARMLAADPNYVRKYTGPGPDTGRYPGSEPAYMGQQQKISGVSELTKANRAYKQSTVIPHQKVRCQQPFRCYTGVKTVDTKLFDKSSEAVRQHSPLMSRFAIDHLTRSLTATVVGEQFASLAAFTHRGQYTADGNCLQPDLRRKDAIALLDILEAEYKDQNSAEHRGYYCSSLAESGRLAVQAVKKDNENFCQNTEIPASVETWFEWLEVYKL